MVSAPNQMPEENWYYNQEKLTSPVLGETFGSFGMGYYETPGESKVYLPMIADHERVTFAPGNEHLSPVKKLQLIKEVWTGKGTLTEIVNQVMNHDNGDEGTLGASSPLEIRSQLYEIVMNPMEEHPRFSVAVVGSSHIGKTNLLAGLNSRGWPVFNLDARDTLGEYTQRISAGHKGPFSESDESPVQDETSFSSDAFQTKVDKLADTQKNTPNNPLLLDTGGFSAQPHKHRPNNPLSALALGQEIIVAVYRGGTDENWREPNEREKILDALDTAVASNPGFINYWSSRAVLPMSIEGDLSTVVDRISAKLGELLEPARQRVLQLRREFVEELADSL